jgi:hypothetical protein
MEAAWPAEDDSCVAVAEDERSVAGQGCAC